MWVEFPEIKNKIRDFSFYPIAPKGRIKKDERISITITSILKRYFLKNPKSAITFVCDSNDYKEKYRYSLFNKWFANSYDKEKYHIEYFTYSGLYNLYAGIILKNNNPQKESITQAYKKIMNLYTIE